MKYFYIIILGYFFLIFGCRNNDNSNYFEINDPVLKEIFINYLKVNIPKKDKMVSLTIYTTFCNQTIYEISTIKHPNEVLWNFYDIICELEGVFILCNGLPDGFLNIHLKDIQLDKLRRQVYKGIDPDGEYEVDLSHEALEEGLIIISESARPYKVFNMGDSIRRHVDYPGQIDKLTGFIKDDCLNLLEDEE